MNIVHKMFAETVMVLEPHILKTKPAKILEISMSEQCGCRYGRLAADCLRRIWDDRTENYIDRVDVSEALMAGTKPYRTVFPLEILDHPESLERYDIIIITDLLEELDPRTAKALVTKLCQSVTNKLILLSSVDEPSGVIFDRNLLNITGDTYLSIPENYRFYIISPKEDAENEA